MHAQLVQAPAVPLFTPLFGMVGQSRVTNLAEGPSSTTFLFADKSSVKLGVLSSARIGSARSTSIPLHRRKHVFRLVREAQTCCFARLHYSRCHALRLERGGHFERHEQNLPLAYSCAWVKVPEKCIQHVGVISSVPHRHKASSRLPQYCENRKKKDVNTLNVSTDTESTKQCETDECCGPAMVRRFPMAAMATLLHLEHGYALGPIQQVACRA